MVEQWHDQFNPRRFLSRVNLEALLQRNQAHNENQIDQIAKPCILCSGRKSPGLLLNDRSYLCKLCFEEVSKITYPEHYEKLLRQHLTELSAREQARSAFVESCWYQKNSRWAAVGCGLSLVLLLFRFDLIVVAIAFGLIHHFTKLKHTEKISKWDALYPYPVSPLLKHFHDPTAELTPRDRMILKVFNNWPGYPPFWGYLREIVLMRDGNRCQVTGCPSRVELHIHHKTPVSKGGEHVPTNLVSLCSFHHALEPDEGHERIWGDIKNRYFTIVREHVRSKSSISGSHKVKAHVRRLELMKKEDLSSIMNFYCFACPSCNSVGNFKSTVESQKVYVECSVCGETWVGKRQLSEESGPKLAEVLLATKNPGAWSPRWDMLEARSDSTFQLIHRERKHNIAGSMLKASRKTIKEIDPGASPICPKCGAPMRMIKPRKGVRWKVFYGCSQYKITGCKGNINT